MLIVIMKQMKYVLVTPGACTRGVLPGTGFLGSCTSVFYAQHTFQEEMTRLVQYQIYAAL